VTCASRSLTPLLLAAGLCACGAPETPPIEGRPGGPYDMTLATDPAAIVPGQPTELTMRLTRANTGEAVQDLQILHERVVHNFIVNLDFSSFAHLHHEDFEPIGAAALKGATFHFPYTFPHAGHYRIVSEFTHHDRSWTKHFDLNIGNTAVTQPVTVDLLREKSFGPYRASLAVSPSVPVAGFETEFVLELNRGDEPVTDLALLLGSEIHVALWRIDGRYFGHTHTYTPHMAAMMAAMYDRAQGPAARADAMAEMMVEMMRAPAELVFKGPRIPVRYVFPEPGTYVIFLQCAPGGTAHVFDFMLDVVPYSDGMDTHIDSMVEPATDHTRHE